MNNYMTDLTRAYGSFDTPDFSFVRRTYDQQPYKQVYADLEAFVQLEDATDLNDDVSFSYDIDAEGNSWFLQLSMVGPYAVLMRTAQGTDPIVVAPSAVDRLPTEIAIMDVLLRHGLAVMEQSELERPIAITLFNNDADQARLYHALFSDVEPLPWQSYEAESDEI